MIFIGIDPGKQGGIAVLKPDRLVAGFVKDQPPAIEVGPTPIIRGKTRKILGGLATKKVSKDQYNIAEMVGVLRVSPVGDTLVVIEKQQNLPPHIAASAHSEFTLGYGYGLWIGIISALGFMCREVRPVDWQALMLVGAPGDDTKKKSVAAAMKLWPDEKFLKTERSRKPSDGLTDAALIAYYGMRVYPTWQKE